MFVSKATCVVVIYFMILEVYCYWVHPRYSNNEEEQKCNDKTFILYNQLAEIDYIKGDTLIVITLTNCQPQSNVSLYNVTETIANTIKYVAIQGSISWSTVEKFQRVIDFRGTDVVPHGVWQECSQLKHLYLTRPNLTLVSGDWLINCKNLIGLQIEDISGVDLLTVLSTANNISELSVNNIEAKNEFYDWAILSAEITKKLSQFTNMTDLGIKTYTPFDLCAPGHHENVIFPSLKKLLLIGTNTSRVCFGKARMMPKLSELTLNEVNLTKFEVTELVSQQTSLRVYFTDSNINEIDGDINMVSKFEIRIEGLIAKVPCDCYKSLFLKNALFEGHIKLSSGSVNCEEDNKPITTKPMEYFYCEKINCQTVCICREPKTYLSSNELNNYMNVDCQFANLSTLPSNLTALEENIQKYRRSPYSEKVILLNGNVDHGMLELSEVEKLFNVESRAFRLVDNSILCTCNNLNLIKALQIHNEQVKDYHDITCVNDQEPLHKVNVDTTNICDERRRETMLRDQQTKIMIIVWSMVIIIVLLLVLAVALQYRRSIQIFMFARGWCLCWLREEELDADRQYDVFLSFCHEDAEVVLEQFLPTLERDYSVCIHLRDWNPGDTILNQITLSVELSRRTVIVLSKNFIKSLWGLLEFRTALACGLEEKRIRLVVIVLDNVVDSSDLQGEFRTYVRLHTYLKWDDPYFWDKLRYVLPHEPNPRAPTLLQQRAVGLPMIMERSAVLPEAEESADASLEISEISPRISEGSDSPPRAADNSDLLPRSTAKTNTLVLAMETGNIIPRAKETASGLSDVAGRSDDIDKVSGY